MERWREEYWWIVGAAWLLGVIILVFVVNAIHQHSVANAPPIAAAPAPAPTPALPNPPTAPGAPSNVPATGTQNSFVPPSDAPPTNNAAATQPGTPLTALIPLPI